MRRAAGLLLLALLAGGVLAPCVAARELPPEIRRMAERAFLEGRLRDLDTILAGAEAPLDRFPLLLRDVWWRRASPVPTLATDTGDGLLRRRLAWLRAPEPRAPYPQAEGGGDPYPILTALVLDRQRRERRGHTGLPQEGPLEALSKRLDPKREQRAVYFAGAWTRRLMSLTYRGPPPHPDQVRKDRAAEDLRVRNGRWALIALGAFLVLILIARLALHRACRGGPKDVGAPT